MVDSFREIKPQEIKENIFKLIGQDWMLITAGTPARLNTMTASWGGVGILWGKPVAWCVIRPQRYTFEFVDQNSAFSLTFFEERYRKMLNFCGTKSGRDVDKMSAMGLTPILGASGAPYFAEARLVLEVRKLYFHDIDPRQFVDPRIADNYPSQDYHRMFVGEIVHVLTQEPAALDD